MPTHAIQAPQAPTGSQHATAKVVPLHRFSLIVLLVFSESAAGDELTAARERAIASYKAASTAAPHWSAGYPARIRESITPHLAWHEDVAVASATEMEIRTSQDGVIIQAKMLKSSGVASWDAAVQAAVAKAGRIPRDANGQVPRVLVMTFLPQQK